MVAGVVAGGNASSNAPIRWRTMISSAVAGVVVLEALVVVTPPRLDPGVRDVPAR